MSLSPGITRSFPPVIPPGDSHREKPMGITRTAGESRPWELLGITGNYRGHWALGEPILPPMAARLSLRHATPEKVC